MKRVLILTGSESFAAQLSETFTRGGYEVCGALGDGAEGVRRLEETACDLAVVDLHLRTYDGITVLEECKKKGIRTAFIVLGNYVDDAVIGRVIEAGARYYMMKPVSAELVLLRADEIAADADSKASRMGETAEVGTMSEMERSERRRAVSLEERISNIFITIGIPPHIRGYGYLREGVRIAVEDPQVLNHVTSELYPVIGEKFETTPSKVERAIRHAIEVAFNKGRLDAVNAIFGARVFLGTERPTNSEFIALVADKLILERLV